MSKLFNLQERESIRIQMLEIGFKLVKEFGMTHTSVEKITKSIGIGKGTFYQYFPSKEVFIYEIIVYQREQKKQKFEYLLNGRERMPSNEAKLYFDELITPGESILTYLTTNDINKLRVSLPEEYFFDPEKDIVTTQILLQHIDGINKELDYKVVANLAKIIGITAESIELLHPEALDTTFQLLKLLLFNYIFGEDNHY
jgi:AcrR family transcriptional regulator